MGTASRSSDPAADLPPNPPVPDARSRSRGRATDPLGRDPVRYGDWERKGIAVDF